MPAVGSNTKTKKSAGIPEAGDTVAGRIITLRKSLGLTPAEFGRGIGASEAAVLLWEGNASAPGCEMLSAIAKKYSADLHELITGEPSPALVKEVRAVREVKHELRLFSNELRAKMNALAKLDRLIAEAEKTADARLKLWKTAKKATGEADNDERKETGSA